MCRATGSTWNPARWAVAQELLQFVSAFGRDGAVGGRRFHEVQPLPLRVVEHNVGQLLVFGHGHTERLQSWFVDIEQLLRCVAEVEQRRSRRELGRELLDDLSLQLAMLSRR